MPKQGEANIDQIWPDDAQLRKDYNEKNRALHSIDINMNSYNPRMQKLRQEDDMRIREFLAQKDAKSNTIRPYKNASNVFVHLVDDPTTRRKVDRNTGRNSCKQKYHALCSLIGALNGLKCSLFRSLTVSLTKPLCKERFLTICLPMTAFWRPDWDRPPYVSNPF